MRHTGPIHTLAGDRKGGNVRENQVNETQDATTTETPTLDELQRRADEVLVAATQIDSPLAKPLAGLAQAVVELVRVVSTNPPRPE